MEAAGDWRTRLTGCKENSLLESQHSFNFISNFNLALIKKKKKRNEEKKWEKQKKARFEEEGRKKEEGKVQESECCLK